MPHIGGFELVLILLAAVLFFGAGKLPTLGKSLGQGIRDFKKGLNGEDDVEDVTPKKKEAITAGEEEKSAEKVAEAVRPK